MSDLRELYHAVILDHNKTPRNFRRPADANHSAEGFNPLCGDKLHVYLKMDNDVVQDVAFVGSGCAISMASASMMTERLKGKTQAEAEALFHDFHDMLTGSPGTETSTLGKLEAFAGVKEFPVRVKCATLPWHTFLAALRGEEKPVSTE
jgi:nitrogen fixation protein NifU and related proteins